MKKFRINVKKIKEFEIELEAKTEEQAMDIVEKFIDDLDIFELDIPSLICEYYELSNAEKEESEEELDEDYNELECEFCKYHCDRCGRCILEDTIL